MSEVYKKLSAPFPEEAISADKSRGPNNVFTSVKAQYVIERLNESFGPENWTFQGSHVSGEQGVLFNGVLTFTIGDKTQTRQAVGYCAWAMSDKADAKMKNIGDVYKSAQTDALSKAASQLGVANDVFKGKVAPPGEGRRPSYEPQARSTPPQAAPASGTANIGSGSVGASNTTANSYFKKA